MENRPKVYVSGPISLGDHVKNIRMGIDAGEELYQNGFIPYIPHTDFLWGLVYEHSWEGWMDIDLEWVKACDALLRLPGESRGADWEVEVATQLLKPVAYSVPQLIDIYYPKEHKELPKTIEDVRKQLSLYVKDIYNKGVEHGKH